MNKPPLHTRELCFAYRENEPVLRGIDLSLRRGELALLVGVNGSGKSTLMGCMDGRLRPDSGEVWLGDQPISHCSSRNRAKRIAVIAQMPALAPGLTVWDTVMLGRFAHRDLWGRGGAVDDRTVEQCLRRMELWQLRWRRADQLSGGQRQRTVIARALAQQAEILLMDEPASHLDLSRQMQLYRLAREQADGGRAVLMIGHDLLLAPRLADRMLVIEDGRVTAEGVPSEVLASAAVKRLLGPDLDVTWPTPDGVQLRGPFG